MKNTNDKQTPSTLVQNMTKHFGSGKQVPDCLPFPAGPLIPRQNTRSPPLTDHGLSNSDRVTLVYQLWREQNQPEDRLKTAYGGLLERLHLLSARDWFSTHGYPWDAKTTATWVLDAWLPLLTQGANETRDAFIYRSDLRHLYMKDRLLDNMRRTPSGQAALAPQCRGLDPRQLAQHKQALEDYCNTQADAPAHLLQRFWFKQFHAHLGFRWEEAQATAVLHKNHVAALFLLDFVSRDESQPMAKLAASLCTLSLLPGPDNPAKQAWSERLRSASPAGQAPLPDCFCPHALGLKMQLPAHEKAEGAKKDKKGRAPFNWPLPQTSLAQARQLWQALGRLPDELDALDALAQHIASMMSKLRVPACAFPAPTYTCACHPRHPGQTLAPVLGALASQCNAAVRAGQQNKWALLQRFFFKQLLSHHGYTWSGSTASSDVHPYFSTALGLLRAIAKTQATTRMGAAARALTMARLLPPSAAKDAEQWFKDLLCANKIGRTVLPGDLPAVFCPGSIGDPERHRALVLALRDSLGVTEEEIDAVDGLARELASLMTDPWVSADLAWTGTTPDTAGLRNSTVANPVQAIEKIAKRYANRLRPSETPSFIQSIDPHTHIAGAIDRICALQKYFLFMWDNWKAIDNRRQPHLAKRKSTQVTP